MKNQEDLMDYIWRYCQEYWTDLEKEANQHHYAQVKLYRFKDRQSRAQELYNELTSTNPEVISLLKDGYDIFKQNLTTRIYDEYGENLNINRCPKCNGVARTPKARQCRHCFHSWH